MSLPRRRTWSHRPRNGDGARSIDVQWCLVTPAAQAGSASCNIRSAVITRMPWRQLDFAHFLARFHVQKVSVLASYRGLRQAEARGRPCHRHLSIGLAGTLTGDAFCRLSPIWYAYVARHSVSTMRLIRSGGTLSLSNPNSG